MMRTAKSPAEIGEAAESSPAVQLQTIRSLRRELRRDDADVRQLVAQLAELPDAAARILTSANSALVGRGTTIRDLRHAVAYIGLRRVDDCLQATASHLERREAGRRAA